METRALLVETATRIFSDHCDKALLDSAERGEFPERLLELLRENGFEALAMESSGVDLSDVFAVLKVAGGFAVPLPLAEMLLGNRWLGSEAELVSVGWQAESGDATVPWGRRAERLITVSMDEGAKLVVGELAEPGSNLAGEPRDRIRVQTSQTLTLAEDAYPLMALSRVVLIAGALERVLGPGLGFVFILLIGLMGTRKLVNSPPVAVLRELD